MRIKHIYLSVLVLLLMSTNILCQVTSAPYSLFGTGQITDNGFGISKAIGGTGIALQSKYSLNNLNPASYASIDSLSFLFEVGAYAKYSRFRSQGETNNDLDGNIRYLAIGFRFTDWWAGSLGAVPYSSVRYKINSINNIEGDPYNYYIKHDTGNGGINQFYFSNAINLSKYFSLGVNTSYLLGSIMHGETVNNIGDMDGYTLISTNYIRGFMLDYGLQVKTDIGKWNYCLGLTYGNEKKLKSRNETYFGTSTDTATLITKKTTYLIPKRYGAGIAISKGNNLLIAADYSNSNLSVTKFNDYYLHTRDAEKYSFGIDYCPRKNLRDYGFMVLNYRLGGYYQKTYLIINNTPINTAAITFGVGIPLRKQLTKINISAELGQTGTVHKGLIRERYCLIHLNFSLHDKWFMKPQYD